jgi:hypothetical protein
MTATMPRERPIIFSSEMIRAIRDGQKTQTRRTYGLDVINVHPDEWCYEGSDPLDLDWHVFDLNHSVVCAGNNRQSLPRKFIKCPYGQVGDRLWVKETWAADRRYDDLAPSALPMSADGSTPSLWWKVDSASKRWLGAKPGRWRSSMFMPRWASRITLELTDVRVERVQEITPDDALAAGVAWYGLGQPSQNTDIHQYRREALAWFEHLWNTIKAKRGYGWRPNPWCWVLEFEVVQP